MATKNVRAKMVCGSVSKAGSDEHETLSVRLSPVTSGSEENETFYKYTPGGTVALEVVNPEVGSFFEEGQEYYVDFSRAK